MNELVYGAVFRDGSILAQATTIPGNIDITAFEAIKSRSSAERTSHIHLAGYDFFILHDTTGLDFIIAADPTVSQCSVETALRNLQTLFFQSFPQRWRTAPHFGLQREFAPQISKVLATVTHDRNAEPQEDDQELVTLLNTVSDEVMETDHGQHLEPIYLRHRRDQWKTTAIVVSIVVVFLVILIVVIAVTLK